MTPRVKTIARRAGRSRRARASVLLSLLLHAGAVAAVSHFGARWTQPPRFALNARITWSSGIPEPQLDAETVAPPEEEIVVTTEPPPPEAPEEAAPVERVPPPVPEDAPPLPETVEPLPLPVESRPFETPVTRHLALRRPVRADLLTATPEPPAAPAVAPAPAEESAIPVTTPPAPLQPGFVEARKADGVCRPPAYPRVAREKGWEGEVLVRIAITADGAVRSATVERSSGYDVLDRAAVEAVLRWRFEPARRAGAAVASDRSLRFVFRLADTGSTVRR